MVQIRFPYSRQEITDADIAAVTDALRGSLITQGPYLEKFEAAFGAFLGGVDVIACNNGTAALHLAYMALGLGPERGLLTTPITFLATANAARMLGAPVVFADVDPETGNLDPKAVRKTLAASPVRIGAIAAVHLAGRPCDMPALRRSADAYGCALVEDACHAPGAVYFDATGTRHFAGGATHADIACFSFHAVKHIAMGEGGAVTTRRPELARRIRLLRTHAMVRDPGLFRNAPEADAPWYYEAAEVGFNYRLTDFQCALGLSQLERIQESLAARRRIASLYDRLFANVPGLRVPRSPQDVEEHAWHLYPLAIDFAGRRTTRARVMSELARRGIGTQVHYIPLYLQPYYREQGHRRLPNADRYYERTLSIPMYPLLTDSNQREIADAIVAALCT